MKKPKVIAVIPARMGSSRFPGKPLANILDLPMIEHVRRRVLLAEMVDEVCVATCDEEIKAVVESHGGNVVMTADTHDRCTDRVEEAVKDLDVDIVVIISGDEPLIMPNVINPLVEPMIQDEGLVCTNTVSVIKNKVDLKDRDVVKAVLDREDYIMCFSRSALPYVRSEGHCTFYRQTGFAAFTKDFLLRFSQLEPTPLEKTESVDFMRILEHRYPIKGVIYNDQTVGVDQKEHITVAEEILTTDPQQKKIYEKIVS